MPMSRVLKLVAMEPLSVLLITLGILSLKSESVQSSCVIQMGIPPPKYVSQFGSKYLVLNTPPTITREMNRKVDLLCANGFKGNYNGGSPTNSKLTNSHLELKCGYNGYFMFGENDLYNQNELSCADAQTSQMYESFTKLPDCENFMTLIVGFNFGVLGSLKKVAICYDIVKKQMKYIRYTAYPSNVINESMDGQLNSFGQDIPVSFADDIFKKISTLDISNALKNDKQLMLLFAEETFEYKSLIQDKALNDDLLFFENMIGIVWLRALRNGNWRHLLNALAMASLTSKYDVRVGVSGIVNLPMLQQCNETRRLNIELNNGDTVPVPAHIWAHIRALKPAAINDTDEFVVVAHNSPFITNSERHGLCNSMCQEIQWLKDTLFSKLQNYPVYGLVQCCRLSDVAHKLDNFPKSDDVPAVTEIST